jgi:hypothetical protein
MKEGVHFHNSYAHVAMMDIIHVVLALGAAQGKQVFVLDIKNAFQNTMEFDPTKLTYNTMSPFFAEYLRLSWNTNLDLLEIEEAPSPFVVHFFVSHRSEILPAYVHVLAPHWAHPQYLGSWCLHLETGRIRNVPHPCHK